MVQVSSTINLSVPPRLADFRDRHSRCPVSSMTSIATLLLYAVFTAEFPVKFRIMIVHINEVLATLYNDDHVNFCKSHATKVSWETQIHTLIDHDCTNRSLLEGASSARLCTFGCVAEGASAMFYPIIQVPSAWKAFIVRYRTGYAYRCRTGRVYGHRDERTEFCMAE